MSGKNHTMSPTGSRVLHHSDSIRHEEPRGELILSPYAAPGAEPRDEETFRILVVCTGNRFRSPLVAALLRSLAADLPVHVESTGTLDLGPVPALPAALAAAGRLGVDLTDHAAVPLTPETGARADLVLGFERMHVATCVIDLNVPRERVFTLAELAGLLGRIDLAPVTTPVERARHAVARAHELRADRPPTAKLAETADPFGASRRATAEIVRQLEMFTGSVFTGLFGDTSSAPPPANDPAAVRSLRP
jgi:protein-tyrosine phosphatase